MASLEKRNKMDFKQSLYTVLLACCCHSTVMAQSFSDKIWVSNDEKTGDPRAEFQFDEHNGTLSGTAQDSSKINPFKIWLLFGD